MAVKIILHKLYGMLEAKKKGQIQLIILIYKNGTVAIAMFSTLD